MEDLPVHTRGYEEALKGRIMRQVLFVHRVRRIVNPLSLKAAFIVMLGVIGSAFVSVQSVVANMPPVYNLGEFFDFVFAAFINAEFVVQALLIAAGLMGVWIIRDVSRNIEALPRRILYSRTK